MSGRRPTTMVASSSSSPLLKLIEPLKPIKQGAEAKIYLTPFLPTEPNNPIIIKHRFTKTYRHPTLNSRLNKERISAEARTLIRASKAGVNVPPIRLVGLEEGIIGLEFIRGWKVGEVLGGDEEEQDGPEKEELAKQWQHLDFTHLPRMIGEQLSKLHKSDIVHGDLTTSNMLIHVLSPESSDFEVVMIDFGLSSQSTLPEDKAVDLYVLERAFSSSHPGTDAFFKEILDTYFATLGPQSKSVEMKLEEASLFDFVLITMPGNRLLSNPPTVEIIACPFSGGQGKSGVDEAPIALLSAGIVPQLEGLGWKVAYQDQQKFTTLSPEEDKDIGKLKHPRLVSAVTEEVAKTVSAACAKGALPLTLGGDHSLALGTVSGTASKYPDFCLLWIDAHADINTPLTTESGNLHGCPVSFLMGLEGCDIPEFAWVKKCLDPSRIVYIGLRDIDDGEKKILKDNKIKAFSMYHVDKYGIGKVVEMALDHVNPDRTRPIHLSFDVDALDPEYAPSTGTPVLGGLTFREGHFICEEVAETGLLVALDIMEVNPSLLDGASVARTIAVGCSLTRAALGETLL